MASTDRPSAAPASATDRPVQLSFAPSEPVRPGYFSGKYSVREQKDPEAHLDQDASTDIGSALSASFASHPCPTEHETVRGSTAEHAWQPGLWSAPFPACIYGQAHFPQPCGTTGSSVSPACFDGSHRYGAGWHAASTSNCYQKQADGCTDLLRAGVPPLPVCDDVRSWNAPSGVDKPTGTVPTSSCKRPAHDEAGAGSQRVDVVVWPCGGRTVNGVIESVWRSCNGLPALPKRQTRSARRKNAREKWRVERAGREQLQAAISNTAGSHHQCEDDVHCGTHSSPRVTEKKSDGGGVDVPDQAAASAPPNSPNAATDQLPKCKSKRVYARNYSTMRERKKRQKKARLQRKGFLTKAELAANEAQNPAKEASSHTASMHHL